MDNCCNFRFLFGYTGNVAKSQMTITANLTKKQKEVLNYIDSFILENGLFPTMHQIKDGLSLSAVST
ncbi:MAG: hypothetical protein ACAH17_01940, partial [Candidatus Paceibacterota bacterium]